MTQDQGQPAGPDDPRSPSAQIEAGTGRFAGRLWVLERVLAWTERPDTRFFVLLGEPGAGKSTFAAWVAGHGRVPQDPTAAAGLQRLRRRWSAVHICRSRAGGTTDPKTFASSISRQLAERHEGFGEAALRYVAPELQITQEVRENYGEVVGVRAGEVVVNSRDADDVYDKAVRQPLRDLAVSRPQSFPIFLLVDGLDEAWGRPEPNIVTLLEGSQDLPDVHFLVTTRDTPAIVERLGGRTRFDLSAAEFGTDNDSDIRAFVDERFDHDARLADAASNEKRQEIVDNVVARASGNFLFVEFLLDEVAAGARELEDLAGSPSGLYPLYRQYLDRLFPERDRPGGDDLWAETYRPLLGSLSVALPTAPQATLPRWLSWETEDLDLRLEAVRQLWEEIAEGTDDSGYRVYHRSLADFLAARSYLDEDRSTTKNPYFAAPKTQHERIATYYLGAGADWSLTDLYGLRQLVGHLRMWLDLEDDPRERQAVAGKLYQVALDPRFRAEQQRRLGGVGATVAACRVALDTALARNDLDVAEQLVTGLGTDLDPELRALAREFAQRIQTVDPRRFARLVKSLLG